MVLLKQIPNTGTCAVTDPQFQHTCKSAGKWMFRLVLLVKLYVMFDVV